MSDEWSDYFDELFDPDPDPREWQDILFGNDLDVDPAAQTIFMEWMGSGFTDERIHQDLVEYMSEAYDIDFDDVFEWEDFHEWYASQ